MKFQWTVLYLMDLMDFRQTSVPLKATFFESGALAATCSPVSFAGEIPTMGPGSTGQAVWITKIAQDARFVHRVCVFSEL